MDKSQGWPPLSAAKQEAIRLLELLTDNQIPPDEIPRVKAQVEAAGLPFHPLMIGPNGEKAIILHINYARGPQDKAP